MIPSLVVKLRVLNYPIDFGLKIKGKRLLGNNKTFRGLVFGIVGAIIFVFLQKTMFPDFGIIDYTNVNFVLLGFLLGFGALFGDIIESFFKRQLRIKPGQSFVPFDQIDWILGSLVFVSFYVQLGVFDWVVAILLFGLLHPLINLVGYYLGIKKGKF